jgi:hypothetical protein
MQNVFVPLLLGMIGLIGLLALVSPRLFESIATNSSRWVDSQKLLAVLDKRIDIDHLILPYCRVLGALVVVSVAVLALMYSRI